jgi:hypothetical protein
MMARKSGLWAASDPLAQFTKLKKLRNKGDNVQQRDLEPELRDQVKVTVSDGPAASFDLHDLPCVGDYTFARVGAMVHEKSEAHVGAFQYTDAAGKQHTVDTSAQWNSLLSEWKRNRMSRVNKRSREMAQSTCKMLADGDAVEKVKGRCLPLTAAPAAHFCHTLVRIRAPLTMRLHPPHTHTHTARASVSHARCAAAKKLWEFVSNPANHKFMTDAFLSLLPSQFDLPGPADGGTMDAYWEQLHTVAAACIWSMCSNSHVGHLKLSHHLSPAIQLLLRLELEPRAKKGEGADRPGWVGPPSARNRMLGGMLACFASDARGRDALASRTAQESVVLLARKQVPEAIATLLISVRFGTAVAAYCSGGGVRASAASWPSSCRPCVCCARVLLRRKRTQAFATRAGIRNTRSRTADGSPAPRATRQGGSTDSHISPLPAAPPPRRPAAPPPHCPAARRRCRGTTTKA